MIILVLSTALIGPYLIDWTSYRETFEREASAFLGKPVRVAGKANIRLLPTPTLNFTDVRVGDDGDHDLTIENIRAELELSSLLKGDISVIQMQVDRPVLRLDVAAFAQPLNGLAAGVARSGPGFNPGAVTLDSVGISSGEIRLFDSRTGQNWTVGSLNAQFEARSLTGPGKVEGGLVLNGEAVSFRASAGRLAPDGAVPLKVTLFPASVPVVTRLSGKLQTQSEDGVVYDGTFSTAELTDAHGEGDEAEGQVDIGDDPMRAVLESIGRFRLSSTDLQLPDIQITYGLRERPLQLAGHGQLRFGTDPYFDISLDARQIDIDRALGGGPDAPVAISAAFAAFVDNLKTLSRAPINGELHLDAKGVVVGGGVIQAVGADLRPTADGWEAEIISAVLPGQTRIDVSGTLQLDEEIGFKGSGKVRSLQPAAFASWWRGNAGDAARIGQFSLNAGLDLTETRQLLSDMSAEIDGGLVEGSIDIRHFQEDGNRVFADIALNAGELDLEKAEAVAGLFGANAVRAGLVDRMSVSLQAGSLRAGGVEARGVNLTGTLEPAVFDLKVLSVEDLAGTSISAIGQISEPFSKPRGQISAEVAAEDLSGAAQFLTTLFPGQAGLSRFASIAGELSPARASLLLSARSDDGRLSLDLSGSFAGTRVTLEMSGTGDPGDLSSIQGEFDGLIVADRTTSLLRQAGLDVLELGAGNPARVLVKGQGRIGDRFTLHTDGTLAGVGFSYSGTGRLAARTGLELDGTFRTDSQAIDDALLLAGITLPGIGSGIALSASGDLAVNGSDVRITISEARFLDEPLDATLSVDLGLPVRVKGDLSVGIVSVPHIASVLMGQLPRLDEGNWPDIPFARAVPGDVALDLDITAGLLSLGAGQTARNAKLQLVLRGNSISIDGLRADWAGGVLQGDMTIGASGQGLEMSLRAAAENVALEEIIWKKDGRSIARGTFGGSVSVAGSGRSLAGLVSTLNGSGSFRIRDGIVRSVNPTAFSSIIRAADTGLMLKPERVRSVFEGYLDAGSLPFDQASGSFGISSGTVRVSTVSFDTASATALGGGMIDLNTRTLSSDWTLKVDPGSERVTGAEPEIGLIFSGSIDDPRRDVDVSPLIGYLTVRAFEKEVRRIEALQANIQEQERLVRLMTVQREQAEQRQRVTEEEHQRAAEEARRQAEDVNRQRAVNAAWLRARNRAAELRTEEEVRRKAFDAARQSVIAAAWSRARVAARRRAELDARFRAEDEARLRAFDAAWLRAEAEAERLDAEQEARWKTENIARLAAWDAAWARSEIAARRRDADEARRREYEKTRLALIADAWQRAEIAAKLRAEEDARRRVDDAFRLAVEEAAWQRAEVAARLRAETDARRRAEDEARLRVVDQAWRRAEVSAHRRAQEEARIRAEEEARLRAEQVAWQRAETVARQRAVEEEQRRVEELRRQADEEARRKAAEDEQRRREADEAVRQAAEEEARLQAAEEEAKRAAEEASRLESEARLQADAGQNSIEGLILQDQQQAGGQTDDLPFGGLDIESIIRNNDGSDSQATAP